MGSASNVLPTRQKIVIHVRECKQGELFFSFLIILSKPVRMHLKFSGTLTSCISLILKGIFYVFRLKLYNSRQDLSLFESKCNLFVYM